MIIGIGVDALDIGRIQRALTRVSVERWGARILSLEEQLHFQQKVSVDQGQDCGNRVCEFMAGRFAAKEAVAKALGCGIGNMVGFKDISVIPNERGKPICTLTETAFQRLGLDRGNIQFHLSITHSKMLAIAYAVVEKQEL